MSSGDMGDDAPCFLLSTGYKVTEWRLQTHAKVSKEYSANCACSPRIHSLRSCRGASAQFSAQNAFAARGLCCRDSNRSSHALVVVYAFLGDHPEARACADTSPARLEADCTCSFSDLQCADLLLLHYVKALLPFPGEKRGSNTPQVSAALY